MSIPGSTDTVKTASPLPANPGAASSKQVTAFNDAVDRSTTSNNSSQQSQNSSTSQGDEASAKPDASALAANENVAAPTAEA